jgi:hypothetical protein
LAQNLVSHRPNGRTPVQRRLDAGSAGEWGAAGDGGQMKEVSIFNVPTNKLFVSGAIASLGAPLVFLLILVFQSVFSKENLEVEAVVILFSISLITSMVITMMLTTAIYVIAKLRVIEVVNVCFASLTSVFGFFVVVYVFSENAVPAIFYSLFGFVNALTFMFLAYRWSKKSNAVL